MLPSSNSVLCGSLLLLLLSSATTVDGQFKIIGLLDASSSAASPQQQRALDTSSPLVKIDAYAARDVPDTLGFGAAQPAAVVESQLLQQHTTDAAVSLPVPATTETGAIQVRIMDEPETSSPVAPQPGDQLVALQQTDNDIVPLKTRVRLLSDVIPPESAGIVVLMDKQSRIYAKSYKPNIRKFAYSEERSFHKTGQNTLADSGDAVLANHRRHVQKLKKISHYRNTFKSRCRCERISNCPRIQITIHRCAQDYFMCCF